jgi:hypothetical protein
VTWTGTFTLILCGLQEEALRMWQKAFGIVSSTMGKRRQPDIVIALALALEVAVPGDP